MGGSPTEWEWLASATSPPNGLVSTRCLDWPRSNFQSNRSLYRRQSSFRGKRDCEARDNSAKTARCPSLVSAETRTRAAEPANSGPFGSSEEISANARLRGGPGRIRTSNQTVMVETDGGLGAGGALVALPYLLEQSKTKYACDRRRDGIGVRPAFLSSPPRG